MNVSQSNGWETGEAAACASGSSRLIGPSPEMRMLRQELAMIGPRECSVLIRGETGCGKELAARDLHQASNRSDQVFVPVDCAALSPALLESQLFGHERGAFTGAEQRTLGFLRSAHRGTVFLDEVGELPLAIQAKLLRTLQQRMVTPVGGTKPIPIDIRLLAATHRDVPAMVEEGTFRSDLHYRLNVVTLEVPPLRDRSGDILVLAEHFLDLISHNYDEPRRILGPKARDALEHYAWPGNVRELANAMEHACAKTWAQEISVAHLPLTIGGGWEPELPLRAAALNDVVVPLEHAQSQLVANALRRCEGHQGRAAAMLQIDRRRLYRMVSRYGLRDLTQRSAR